MMQAGKIGARGANGFIGRGIAGLGALALATLAACAPQPSAPVQPTRSAVAPGAPIVYEGLTYQAGVGATRQSYGDENLDKVFGGSGASASSAGSSGTSDADAAALAAATTAALAATGGDGSVGIAMGGAGQGAQPTNGQMVTVLRTSGAAMTYADGYTAKQVARIACQRENGTFNEAAQGRFAGNGTWAFDGVCS